MVSYYLCSVFTDKKLQFIDLLLEMELAILQLNVHPKVEQLQEIVHQGKKIQLRVQYNDIESQF